MQDIAGFGLNCTANDVQISRANVLEIIDECEYPGDTTTFVADFEVVVTAKERFDIGLYFATDGDPNGDGAISEGPFDLTKPDNPPGCSVSTIGPENPSSFIDLDDYPLTGDSCGDITKGTDLNAPIKITAVCVDPDGDGKLNLPNCTSWRQSGANEMCDSPDDAYPGSPSKCRCDGDFQVDVPVPPAELKVTKTPQPTSVQEPGGNVTFQIDAFNAGVDPANAITLDKMTDSVFGDVMDATNNEITTNNCYNINPALDQGGTATCQFSGWVGGNAGDEHYNVATVSGLDQRDPPNRIEGSDEATVTITDVMPVISVDKSASVSEVGEAGGDVTYTVKVTNESVSSDPVTIKSIVDSVDGIDVDVTALAGSTCATGVEILPAETYECVFALSLDASSCPMDPDNPQQQLQPPCAHTNLVTVKATDDDGVNGGEGNEAMDFDSATVTITNSPSSVEVTKEASFDKVPENGQNVQFTFTIKNTSTWDTVTIDSLSDSVFGDLNGEGDCAAPQTLAPNAIYSCSITRLLEGLPGTAHMNVFTASGMDDDGYEVSGSDDATVSYVDVPPAATVSLKASALVTYDVEVRNDSTADELTIGAIVDDHYGDLTDVNNQMVTWSDCASGSVLAKKGEAGDTYQCSFTAEPGCSPLANAVTASVDDDDKPDDPVSATSGTVSVSVSGLGACEAPTQ